MEDCFQGEDIVRIGGKELKVDGAVEIPEDRENLPAIPASFISISNPERPRRALARTMDWIDECHPGGPHSIQTRIGSASTRPERQLAASNAPEWNIYPWPNSLQRQDMCLPIGSYQNQLLDSDR